MKSAVLDRGALNYCKFPIRKPGTEAWHLADARCPASYQFRCPTFCRKPDSGSLTALCGGKETKNS